MNNFIIGILSAASNKTERDAIRQSWAQDAIRLGIPYVFICGSHVVITQKHEDLLMVACEERPDYLSLKVKSFCEWAVKEGYDWAFKCDDDTYVDCQKLKDYEPKSQYVGNRILSNVASGGAGYILGKKAMTVVAKHTLVADRREDVAIGALLFRNNIQIVQESRFDPAHHQKDHKFPRPDNDMITTHYMTPKMMINNYKENNKT